MEERPLIVGAVATHPESVLVWEGIRAHFLDLGAPMDFTLYSNFDRLTDQLMGGHVDLAWLSPLAFVRVRRRTGPIVVPILVGDTERETRTHLVMRENDVRFSPEALHGVTLAVGSRDSARARILPLYGLRQAGVDIGSLRVLPQELDVGKGGETSRAELEVLAAVREGRARAGVVSDAVWRHAGSLADGLRVSWSTAPYDGAVFCALASVPTIFRTSFERVMRAMDASNPRQRQVLERVHVGGWVPAREAGYVTLRQAVEDNSAW